MLNSKTYTPCGPSGAPPLRRHAHIHYPSPFLALCTSINTFVVNWWNSGVSACMDFYFILLLNPCRRSQSRSGSALLRFASRARGTWCRKSAPAGAVFCKRWFIIFICNYFTLLERAFFVLFCFLLLKLAFISDQVTAWENICKSAISSGNAIVLIVSFKEAKAVLV